jgi:hypothetical protein
MQVLARPGPPSPVQQRPSRRRAPSAAGAGGCPLWANGFDDDDGTKNAFGVLTVGQVIPRQNN